MGGGGGKLVIVSKLFHLLAVFLMCIFGMVFYPIYIFVPLPTPHHRADVRLVLTVGASVASEREFTLDCSDYMPHTQKNQMIIC